MVGIQDLGGAGLACATSETAARGGVGMDVDVTAVPRREAGMEPWEVMTSESQERMLAIVTPADWEEVAEVCRRWEVRATVVGRVTDEAGRLRIRDGLDGPVLADVPAASLADDAPLYDRPGPAGRPGGPPGRRPGSTWPRRWTAELLAMLADPTWVYRQYDHQLFLNTVEGPGGDAALLRLAGPGLPPSRRGLALTTDATPRWCALDPRAGTALTLAEAVANLACVGARAVAVVNCLNFGNPEHPEVMWQLSEAIDGLAEACSAFGLPVVGRQRQPVQRERRGRHRPDAGPRRPRSGRPAGPPPPGAGWTDGATVILLGARRALGRRPPPAGGQPLGGRGARPPGRRPAPAQPGRPRRLVDLVAALVAEPVAGGAARSAGSTTSRAAGWGWPWPRWRRAAGWPGRRLDDHPAELFSEPPSRVLVATDRPHEVLARAAAAGVPAAVLGRAGGERLVGGRRSRPGAGRGRRRPGRRPARRRRATGSKGAMCPGGAAEVPMVSPPGGRPGRPGSRRAPTGRPADPHRQVGLDRPVVVRPAGGHQAVALGQLGQVGPLVAVVARRRSPRCRRGRGRPAPPPPLELAPGEPQGEGVGQHRHPARLPGQGAPRPVSRALGTWAGRP